MSGMYPSYQRSMTRVVRKVHAVSAAVLTLYLLPHIVNHVVALLAGALRRAGRGRGRATRLPESHLTFQEAP